MNKTSKIQPLIFTIELYIKPKKAKLDLETKLKREREGTVSIVKIVFEL